MARSKGARRPDPDVVAQLRADWAGMDATERENVLAGLGEQARQAVAEAIGGALDALRPDQQPPAGDWSIWALLAGRGFGKTHAGTEWVLGLAGTLPAKRIALVGASLDAARTVMVEGASGLLARAPASAGLSFEPSRRRLRWRNGSEAHLFSGGEPDLLRGPQFHHAWGDEVAHWPDGEAALTNLRLGIRLGEAPQLLLTTTPRPHGWLKALLAEPGVVVTRGRTSDNRALPAEFIAAMQRRYAGTLIGRQELDGEIIEDLAGALWTRALLDGCRTKAAAGVTRVVVGVDPPAGGAEGVCGIVVAGLGPDGNAVVLADASVAGAGPNGWARAVVAAAAAHDADRVIVEINNGGDMVTAVLQSVGATLAIQPVRAAHGKVARAEPVASLYREGRVNHSGAMPLLEDQLCGMLESGVYAGPGRSPDRADALVWAIWALLLGNAPGQPAVRSL